jgi:hypothetical protein
MKGLTGSACSFFGEQEGDFSLTLRSIEAVAVEKEEQTGQDGRLSSASGDSGLGKPKDAEEPESQGWLQWLMGRSWKL